MGQIIEMSGQKFGRLTVICFDRVAGRRRTMWKCVCDCGKEVSVDGVHLRSGHTTSCGCYRDDHIKNVNFKTGLSNSPLYRTYRNMLNRCYYPKSRSFKDYGKRGIVVCDEWRGEKGFENFANWAFSVGYNETLSIDRINPDANYSPDNCRWITMFEQAGNKRNTHFLEINGEIDTVANWSKKLNISYWNLLNYAKGTQNCSYPDLEIKVVENE